MRIVLLVLACSFLAGCPPHLKVYVHNNSDDTIRVGSSRTQSEMTTIGAGRAKTIQAGSVDDVCLEVSVGGDVRVYSLDFHSGPYINSTTYGGRVDLHYEGGAIYVRSNKGEQLEILARAQCVE